MYKHQEAIKSKQNRFVLFLSSNTGILSLGQEDPQENERTTYSSILAWEIPWTEDPGSLQPMGSLELDMTC